MLSPKIKNKARISALITVIHQFTRSLVMMQNRDKKIELEKELKLFFKNAMSVYVEKTMKSEKKHQIHEISTNLAIYVKSVH